MIWAGLVEHKREKIKLYEVLGENLKKRDRLEELGIDGWILLKWVLRK
jgi:hypothetical protein